jgi:hypothetical protein
MRPQKISSIFFALMLINGLAFSQKLTIHKDSSNLYKDIQFFSGKNKLTKLIYPFIFKPTTDTVGRKENLEGGSITQVETLHHLYEGKIIRKITIETLGPFGYSINDTLASPHHFLTKTGNKLHVKTKKLTIRNLLLIRKNTVFDSFLVKESERLIRSVGYIRDVSFVFKTITQSPDSVDICIRVMDNWSIIPQIGISATQLSVNLRDYNFMGLGHEFKNNYTWSQPKAGNAYFINYRIPNIRNTYISSTFHYGTNEFRNYSQSFTVNRPFFSPIAKWAAGVSFVQEFRQDSFLMDDIFVYQDIKFNIQDYWAGWAFKKLKVSHVDNRTTNFISAIRFSRVRYLLKPNQLLDPEQIYANENLYLLSLGISKRKYVRDKFIFKYGITEDVPIGSVYNITSGFRNKNNRTSLYLGLRFSMGNYYRWGYLSSNFEYGSFFDSAMAKQGVCAASINYFTKLIEVGKWKIRQFVKPQFTIGIKRFVSDSLTLNDGFGLDGFNSLLLSGTKRAILTLQTQFYSPWKLIGFRFGPYITCSFGMLGSESLSLTRSKLYSQIGLGVLIKNENLVINTFQFSIAYYPNIPGHGTDIFKMNSFRSTNFGFKDFEIGKPAIVVFQ